MAAQESTKLQGISQLLVMDNLLDPEKALHYQNLADTKKTNIIQYLVKNNLLEANKISSCLAKNFALPMLDLNAIDKTTLPITLIDEKLIYKHRVLPLCKRANQLFLAIDDPSKQNTFKELQFHTKLSINLVVVQVDTLNEYIEALLSARKDQGLSNYFQDEDDNDNLEYASSEDELEEDDANNMAGADDAPVVKFINHILLDAIKKGISDIHFEPYEQKYRIRYRQDGLLNEIANPPINLANRIAARIKVMSSLDISERRIPQDGRFKMRLSKTRAIDFRVSTCPTVAGEKIVMRILDPTSTRLGIEALGFNEIQKKLFLSAIDKPQGMLLVTGPTGSGKTVTLYTALNILNTIDKNISTAEDPVEIKVAGINQVNVNPKAGLHFADALRSFLRQDPDIIMVGEIRDLETAEIAVKAAQTGHFVLSTLHTNSAAETLTRLVNMGVPSFNIASSVTLIIAQRLVRKLCENCKVLQKDIPKHSLEELGFTTKDLENITIYEPKGCPQCSNGYKGRIGLYEVMPISKELGNLIMNGGNSLDILKTAQKEGMLTIYQSGLEKVRLGITTIAEVNRVSVD